MSRNPAAALVLGRVNTVLVIAGLNDTVWSIRDCDSTLFVLIYKKLVGKLPGIESSPTTEAEHAGNFRIVLDAISSACPAAVSGRWPRCRRGRRS